MLPYAMDQSPPEAGESRFDRGSHFNRVVSPFSISMIQLISRSLRSSAHHSSRDRLYSQCLVSAYRAFQSKHTFFVSYSRQRLGLICTKVKQCTVLTPLPFPPSSPPILSPTICKVFPHPSPLKNNRIRHLVCLDWMRPPDCRTDTARSMLSAGSRQRLGKVSTSSNQLFSLRHHARPGGASDNQNSS